MPSIAYQFPVYSTVYHVNETYGIREAVVAHVTINIINPSSTVLTYIIQFKKMPGMDVSCVETDLHADLPSALTAYSLLVPA
jgi:hypothetical protein